MVNLNVTHFMDIPLSAYIFRYYMWMGLLYLPKMIYDFVRVCYKIKDKRKLDHMYSY